MNYYIGNISFDANYLEHHGILGMKWGKRNGPPYPLDAQDHSADEKKAGWRESLKTKKQEKERNKVIKKFNTKINKTFYIPYNKATDKFNKQLKDINEKYSGDLGWNGHTYTTSLGKQYLEEVSKTWKELYISELEKFYKNDIIVLGRDWVENAPYMRSYD